MNVKKVLFKRGILASVLLLGLQLTAVYAQKSKVRDNIDLVFHNTSELLQKIHYAPKELDDNFAAKIFTSYLEQLDPGKKFFRREDIESFKKYENGLDDEMRGRNVQFYKIVNSIFAQRLKEAETLVTQQLEKPFTFNSPETYNAKSEGLQWCNSDEDLKKRWSNYLKFQVLVRYDDLLALQQNDSVETDNEQQLESKARASVLKVEKRNIENLQKLTTEEESFNTYINSIINLYDPHSYYFLPIDRRGFQENMSGIYYGIGALLSEQNGKISIGELMIGGPAWKSGQVEQGDVIMRVAQGKEKAVDVAGMDMDEVIKLTRGQKDTYVTITFRKKDGSLKDVSMHREPLQLEDTFVKSAVIEDSSRRIGYISFPRFYTDFGDENGRSCARDMARELIKLKNENVEGIIIDIRNNGGGSLGEVINMVGLFVDNGPVVQVKSPFGKPYIANTNNEEKLYDGPLVVLVNELSASASEIFAAAIQDYKRGIIIGSTSTFGKGSVQRSFGISDKKLISAQATDLGTLNITLQKYYRITGEATQLKGITPDITLPGIYEPYEVQEKNNPNALAWDTIAAVPYRTFEGSMLLPRVVAMSKLRIKQDTVLQYLQDNLNWLHNRSMLYSLQLDKYRKEQDLLQQKVSSIRKELLTDNIINIRNTREGDAALQDREQFRIDGNKAWLTRLQKDLFLSESVYVMRDYLSLKNI